MLQQLSKAKKEREATKDHEVMTALMEELDHRERQVIEEQKVNKVRLWFEFEFVFLNKYSIITDF